MSFKPRLFLPDGSPSLDVMLKNDPVIYPEVGEKIALLVGAANAVRRHLAIAFRGELDGRGMADLSPEACARYPLTARFLPRKIRDDSRAWKDINIIHVHGVTRYSVPLGIYDTRTEEKRFRKTAPRGRNRDTALNALEMDQRFLEFCAARESLKGIVPFPLERYHDDFIEMEFIPGITLRKYINTLLESYVCARGMERFPEKSDHFMHAILDAIAKFADNLGHLHDAGFTHNDAKLNNVVVVNGAGHTHYREFVDSAEPIVRTVIVDLASVTQIYNTFSNPMIHRVRTAGKFFGTRNYMPIETLHVEPSILGAPYRDLRSVAVALAHTMASMMEGEIEYDAAKDITCKKVEIGDMVSSYFSLAQTLEYLRKNLPNEEKWRDVLAFITEVLCDEETEFNGHDLAERLEALATDFTPELDRSSLTLPEEFKDIEPLPPDAGGGETDT